MHGSWSPRSGLRILLLAVLSAVACGPGLADPAPWLVAPDSVDAELVPGVTTPVAIALENTGTATAFVRASATGGAQLPEVRLQLAPGERTDLVVQMTSDGYQPVDGAVELRVRDDLQTVVLRGTVPSDVDGDGYDAVEVGGDDCDDLDPARHPGASEVCNGVDEDCNDAVDEGLDEKMFWFDADDDGFGDPASTPVSACRAPDGHVDNDDDCADDDSSVSPGATETWYDGVDQDCDGLSDYDQDLDGVDAADQGGMDCDDEDATVYPGAVELDDGVDNDCDTYRDEDVVRPGDLVITEVFVEPVSGTPGDGEWLELINVSSTHADLALVRIEVDGVGALLSETSLPMPPQAVWMVCANPSPAANGGVDPCGSVLALPTGARSFVLEGPEGVVDEVDARGWSFTPGRSLELGDAHLDADDNDVESAWCPAVSLFGDAAGDRGTPGSFLPPCP